MRRILFDWGGGTRWANELHLVADDEEQELVVVVSLLVLEQRSDSFVAEERRERGEEEEMKRGGRRPGSGSPGGRLPDDEAFSYLLSLCFFFLCSLFSPEASVSFHDDDGYALRASFEFFFFEKICL